MSWRRMFPGAGSILVHCAVCGYPCYRRAETPDEPTMHEKQHDGPMDLVPEDVPSIEPEKQE